MALEYSIRVGPIIPNNPKFFYQQQYWRYYTKILQLYPGFSLPMVTFIVLGFEISFKALIIKSCCSSSERNFWLSHILKFGCSNIFDLPAEIIRVFSIESSRFSINISSNILISHHIQSFHFYRLNNFISNSEIFSSEIIV